MLKEAMHKRRSRGSARARERARGFATLPRETEGDTGVSGVGTLSCGALLRLGALQEPRAQALSRSGRRGQIHRPLPLGVQLRARAW